MRTTEEALAELESLPQLTREVEDAVHLHGILPSTIARALGLPEAEIRAHLQAARLARSLVLEAGCADETPIVAQPPPPRAIKPVRELEVEERPGQVPAPVCRPTRPRWTEATLQQARLKQQARLAMQVTEPTCRFSAAALFGIQPASTGGPPEQDHKQP